MATTKRPRRKQRNYEQTCECSKYPFPHRMFGGRCCGQHIVEAGYGKPECTSCTLHDQGYCDVLSGIESPKYCQHVIDFVHFNEIRLYNRRLGSMVL